MSFCSDLLHRHTSTILNMPVGWISNDAEHIKGLKKLLAIETIYANADCLIYFTMVVLQSESCGDSETQEISTTLSYTVDVKPKLWLPIRLIEGRLCQEIKVNLLSIRDEAQKATHRALNAH